MASFLHRPHMATCVVLFFSFGAFGLQTGGARLQAKLTVNHDEQLSEASFPGSTINCTCLANSSEWQPTNRTVPKCVFIDLGAADGNTFREFLNDTYGNITNCPSDEWEAYLVEANPIFDAPLQELAAQYPGQVHVMPSTAAYTCVSQTSFYVDPDPDHNYWGSSMSGDKSMNDGSPARTHQKITVPTMNVVQLIAESVFPADYVILKVDIEGAEYDVVPCLATSANASLVDIAYIEEHNRIFRSSVEWQQGASERDAAMDAAKQTLRSEGVDTPDYESGTL